MLALSAALLSPQGLTTGSLLVSTVRRVPVRLELSGEMTTGKELERERDGRLFSIHHTQGGPVRLTMTVEEP